MSISGLQPEESGRMLCIMNGAGAAFSGGALGYVFGFGEHLYVAEIRSQNALDINSTEILEHSFNNFSILQAPSSSGTGAKTDGKLAERKAGLPQRSANREN